MRQHQNWLRIALEQALSLVSCTVMSSCSSFTGKKLQCKNYVSCYYDVYTPIPDCKLGVLPRIFGVVVGYLLH